MPYNATVKGSGKPVKVYQLKFGSTEAGKWMDYDLMSEEHKDRKRTYEESELTIDKSKEA